MTPSAISAFPIHAATDNQDSLRLGYKPLLHSTSCSCSAMPLPNEAY